MIEKTRFILENHPTENVSFCILDSVVIEYAKRLNIYDKLIAPNDLGDSNILITKNEKNAFVFKYDCGHKKPDDNGFTMIAVKDIEDEFYIRLNFFAMTHAKGFEFGSRKA